MSIDNRGVSYVDGIAHITLADGTVFQVLNDTGDDWDEAATMAAVEAYKPKK